MRQDLPEMPGYLYVYVSYAAEDEATVAVLAEALDRRGLEIWRPKADVNVTGPMVGKLDEADAVLVVWSAASVHNDRVLREAAQAGDRLIPVLLTTEARIPDPFSSLPAVDLTTWTGGLADPLLDRLAMALSARLDGDGTAASIPIDEPAPADPFTYSDNAMRIIRWAARRSQSAPSDATTMLVSALLQTWQAGEAGVARALVNALVARLPEKHSAGSVLNLLGTFFPGAENDPSLADDDRLPPSTPLTRLAADCAVRLLGRPEIHTRHLLAAAVLTDRPPLSPQLLDALSISPAALRRLLWQVITRETVTGESAAVWEAILLGTPDRLAGGISADLVDPNRDIPLDQDDLRFGVWASMFATVIADRNTPMPVSIGLFGEWGSGKSHFMGLLRAEIRRLCASGQPAYLSSSDVVQIGFNAWHYADTNLWASLGDEIFRQLADAPATPRQIRDEVRRQITDGRVVQREFKDLADRAREEKERLRAEVDEATKNRQLRASDLLTAAKRSPELSRQLSQVWRRLGVSDEADQARLLADQLSGASLDAREIRGLFFTRRTWVLAVICLIALLVTVAGVLIPAEWGTRLRDDGAVSTLALVLTSAVAVAGGVSTGLRQLRKVATELAEGADAAADQRSDIARKRAELKEAEAEEEKAQAQLQQATAQVEELERRLVELMPGRRLYTFLAERAASGDYTSQLGLISVIRKDFERLAVLLKDQDEAEEVPGPRAGSRKIGRIVLYIDDLDRCRADQVVDVLQAVHLLLALDLFVVVVGVDPRWLMRSLQDRYRGTLDAGVTPANYLEKIFNIPFVLPAFPDDGLGNLVRRIAALSPAADTRPAAAASPTVTAVLAGTAVASATADDAESITVEAGSEIADARAADAPRTPAPLTERELEFLAALGPFVSTPRDAKRLFNLYRMLRATRDLSPASDFLGNDVRAGEFQAVAMLLAMLTADDDLLGHVLDAPRTDDPRVAGGLVRQPSDGMRWSDFAASLSPRLAGDTWENQVVGQIPGTEVPAWQRLAGATMRTCELVQLDDLSAFQRWAPRIRRFSYRLSRQAPG